VLDGRHGTSDPKVLKRPEERRVHRRMEPVGGKTDRVDQIEVRVAKEQQPGLVCDRR
jgi:hypothetical protein